jgi:hypothetical protein
MHSAALESSLRDLQDALDDLINGSSHNASNILERFAVAFGLEPLAGFLVSVLPPIDPAKRGQLMTRGVGTIGTGKINWPADRAERVAYQVDVIKHLAANPRDVIPLLHEYYNCGYNNFTGDIQKFADGMIRPMLRDLERLAEGRPLPPVLFEAMGVLPPSGDAILDGLLRASIAKFKDAAPAVRKEGLERLWDAWERLKTLEAVTDKKVSIGLLLDRAASQPQFRSVLEEEAKALTSIGNDFHIRHFETNRAPVESEAHIDYLYHRLYALVHLLLYSRGSRVHAS